MKHGQKVMICLGLAILFIILVVTEVNANNTKRVETILLAAEKQRQQAASKELTSSSPVKDQLYTIPSLGMKFVYVAPGSFQMGSNDGAKDDRPAHRVTISKSYWIGKCEVTQCEYQSIMGNNPSHFKGDNKPVEMVSWNDAVKFCEKLTKRERAAGRLPTGYEYRLPTEAEWEYAARGGNKSRNYNYSGADNINSVAWYSSNFGGQTHEVGTKAANELGICDMSGNVWEWSLDNCNYKSGVVTDTYKNSIVDPLCKTGSFRVFRGGSGFSCARLCRLAYRFRFSPDRSHPYLGFRVALASSSR